jgi:hypothetical protein
MRQGRRSALAIGGGRGLDRDDDRPLTLTLSPADGGEGNAGPPQGPLPLPRPKECPGRLDQHSGDFSTEEWSEISQIARQQVCRASGQGGSKNGFVLLREVNGCRNLLARTLGDDLERSKKSFQSREALRSIEVPSRFFRRIARSQQVHIASTP